MIGWLHPIILLPAASLTGLTPGQLEAILAHELAHVRRLDYLVNGFQCLVETLLFYHPVVWWISRCVREEREHCCDDLVLEVCEDRLVYARALAALEQSRAGLPEFAFAANGGSLLNRIRRLLGTPDPSAPMTAWQISGLGLLAIGLVFIALGVYLMLGPASYRAEARIRVEPAALEPAGASDAREKSNADPYFVQTEFEVIRSEAVLGRVIKSLDLNQEWGRRFAEGEPLKTQETLLLLRNKIQLRSIRHTRLIDIAVLSGNRDEAARIADAIANSYHDYRLEEREKPQKAGLAVLIEREREQAAKAQAAQIEVEKLRQSLQIPDAVGNADGPGMMLTAESLRRIEALRIESQTELTRQETLLTLLRKLGAERGSDTLTQVMLTANQDTLLTALMEQLAIAEQRLLAVKQQYGPAHIEVTSGVAQVEDLQRKIKERMDGILAGLEARVRSLREGMHELEQQVANAKNNDIEQANSSRPYFDAKRNRDELLQFQRLLQMKIAAENIDVALPIRADVEIVDQAVPPLRPASPNRPQAAALILIGLLLEVTGSVLVRGKRGNPPQLCPA